MADTEALKERTFKEFVDKECLPHCEATHTKEPFRSDNTFFRGVMLIFGRRPLRSITTGDLQRFVGLTHECPS
jgi:hypothetical protein